MAVQVDIGTFYYQRNAAFRRQQDENERFCRVNAAFQSALHLVSMMCRCDY
jgi:hypothetical protein